MCNPRRVHITVTKEISAAWSEEIKRVSEFGAQVQGTARSLQALDNTMATPVLRALESALARGVEGWNEVEVGYRCDLDGGYCIYHLQTQSLEMVAVATQTLKAKAEATRLVSGLATQELEIGGRGHYFDDGWRGRDEDHGLRQAEDETEQKARLHKEILEAKGVRDAQLEHGDEVEAEAKAKAQALWQQLATDKQEQLRQQAAGELAEVGKRAKRAFHQLLAKAYRDTLLALARREGAEVVKNNDNGQILEVELRIKR